MLNSKFTELHWYPGPKIIRLRDDLWDRRNQAGLKSLTNDVEAVVESMLAKYGPDVRIDYFDTIGKLVRLLHDGQRFTGFMLGGWPQAPEGKGGA